MYRFDKCIKFQTEFCLGRGIKSASLATINLNLKTININICFHINIMTIII